MQEWIRRVELVAEFYIEEVVKASVKVGLPSTDVQFCSDYLKDRRKRLKQLVHDNVKCFPCVQQGSMTLLDGGTS